MGPRDEKSISKSIFQSVESSKALGLIYDKSRAVIGTTGGWRDSHRMSEAVEKGDIDMIGLGRPLREDPFFVNKVLRGEVRKSNL
jgi:2,4-dienoyl-CoA reductase-like NADH-dependent reductase (Old Yellow Enzyme family)